jgi:ADP-heptose:LPS heptosyltransferase
MLVDHLTVPTVERIAVLRANRLGDLVLALPALRALRSAYPHAEITLLTAGWHPRLLVGRPGPWDRVEVVPGCPGVRDTDTDVHDPAAVQRFLAAQRRRRYDLAVQLHGGGAHSNPFVRALDAALAVGARDRGAPALDRDVPYVVTAHEVLRLLEVVALVGARTADLEPVLAVTAPDLAAAAAVLPDDGRPLVALHLGASDPRRRWPVARFAAVADDLAARGARVVVVGSGPDDARAARALRTAVRTPVVDLVGRLGLPALTGLLARCSLVVANDSGPRHLAAAVGASSVGVFLAPNALTAGPLTARRSRIAVSYRTRCPVCDQDERQSRCGHDASLVADVEVDEVRQLARELFDAACAERRPSARPAFPSSVAG